MNLIETYNLTKRFGDTVAVNNVSIHVREGEIYGFLGLNGAGKTTLIRLLLSMIKPDSGSIKLFGKELKSGSYDWNKVGYMVETPYSYPNLTVKENLEVFYNLRGLKDKKLIDKTIEILQLTRYADKKSKHLSLGNNQRLGLAKALIHNPQLLLLDEPINGLDPAGIVEVREFMKSLAVEHGTTIFLSSHILSEISKLATRIGIVHYGKLIREINTTDLEDQIIRKLQVNTNDNTKALQLLAMHGYNFKLNETGLLISIDKVAIQSTDKISVLLVLNDIPPLEIHVFEEDLESYFLRMVGQEEHQTIVR
ncbi:MAG TPA: ABC transporter ATP-binding protein [Lentimicrobium sp.]|nr:ABC transporter ATP-binding protein [Lentimicrobium sp.]